MSVELHQSIQNFTALTTSGLTFHLADYQGKANVVLYFYPKDNTPGCTTEAQNFRDHYAAFQALDTVIIGISRDSLRTHENFKTKHQLPFELISDSDETLCRYFDVIKLKTLYGKQHLGIERSTFLIDKTGILRQEWRKVSVPSHVEAVLAALSSPLLSHHY